MQEMEPTDLHELAKFLSQLKQSKLR